MILTGQELMGLGYKAVTSVDIVDFLDVERMEKEFIRAVEERIRDYIAKDYNLESLSVKNGGISAYGTRKGFLDKAFGCSRNSISASMPEFYLQSENIESYTDDRIPEDCLGKIRLAESHRIENFKIYYVTLLNKKLAKRVVVGEIGEKMIYINSWESGMGSHTLRDDFINSSMETLRDVNLVNID